jgi:hypothetical protein
MWGNGIIRVGAIVVFVGVINLFFLYEFPEDKGIVIEEESHILDFTQKNQIISEDVNGPGVKIEKSISFVQALLIPGVLLFSISFFFIKFSMYGFYYWLPSYL